jgi:hypothetical protein
MINFNSAHTSRVMKTVTAVRNVKEVVQLPSFVPEFNTPAKNTVNRSNMTQKSTACSEGGSPISFKNADPSEIKKSLFQ